MIPKDCPVSNIRLESTRGRCAPTLTSGESSLPAASSAAIHCTEKELPVMSKGGRDSSPPWASGDHGFFTHTRLCFRGTRNREGEDYSHSHHCSKLLTFKRRRVCTTSFHNHRIWSPRNRKAGTMKPKFLGTTWTCWLPHCHTHLPAIFTMHHSGSDGAVASAASRDTHIPYQSTSSTAPLPIQHLANAPGKLQGRLKCSGPCPVGLRAGDLIFSSLFSKHVLGRQGAQ